MQPVRFTLNEELVVKAALLNASRYYARFLVFAMVVALLTSAFFLFSRSDWVVEREVMQALLIIASTLAFALLLHGCLRYWIYPAQARKNFRQQKTLSEAMSLSWTDSVFCYAAGKSQIEMPFSSLHGYRASGEIVLLYHSDVIYQVVPAVAFGGPDAFDGFIRKLEAAGLRRR
jgi:hypothetical protein